MHHSIPLCLFAAWVDVLQSTIFIVFHCSNIRLRHEPNAGQAMARLTSQLPWIASRVESRGTFVGECTCAPAFPSTKCTVHRCNDPTTATIFWTVALIISRRITTISFARAHLHSNHHMKIMSSDLSSVSRVCCYLPSPTWH